MKISKKDNFICITDERRKSVTINIINIVKQTDKFDPIRLVFIENLLNRKTDDENTPSFLKKCVELYNAKFSIKTNDFKLNNTITYSVKFVDSNVINDIDINSVLKLFNDYMTQKDINKDEFKVFKTDYINYLKYLKTQYDELSMRYLEDNSKSPNWITFEEEINYVTNITIDDVKSYLDNISYENSFQINTSKELYDLKLIKDDSNVYVENYKVMEFEDVCLDYNNEQASIKLLYTYDDLDFNTVQLYSFILGGDVNSLLFTNVREKEKLAYSVYSMTYLKQAIVVAIQTGVNNIDKSISEINKQFTYMDTITEEQLISFKEKYISLLNKNKNVVKFQQTRQLNNLIFNEHITIDDKINIIKNIKLNDIINVTKKLKLNGKVIIK